MFSRSFYAFFAAQALGAFNDNLYRNAIVLLATFVAATPAHGASIAALSSGVFVLPFFLLSAAAGKLADHYDKARLVRWLKFSEVLIMLLAALGFYLMQLWFLLVVLFLMGAQSALFGPVKYAILPQLTPASRLLLANAWIEATTFLVILLGMMLSSALMFTDHGRLWVSIGCVLVALAGALASRFIAPLPPPPNLPALRLHPVRDLVETLRHGAAPASQRVRMIGVAWFWAVGSVFVTLIPAFCQHLGDDAPSHVIWLLSAFASGIAFGALACARLSHGTPRLSDVAGGSVGMALAITAMVLLPALGIVPPAQLTAFYAACLFAAASAGGFFVVPLYTLIQHQAPAEQRGQTIAASNICNALSVCLASAINSLLLQAGLPIEYVFAGWTLATPLLWALLSTYAKQQ